MRTGTKYFTLLALSFLLSTDGFGQDTNSSLSFFEYRNVGPTRGGRATAVCGDASNPGTFYMGTTGGGLWKTTDYGSKWENISDGYFATPSIGAVQVAKTDGNIIYVGTGSDGIRSNVIKGLGMYKSADAGSTWEFIGLREAGQIGAVEVHPDNPDIVFVAAIGNPFGPHSQRGVFKSTDGGQSWKKTLFVSNQTGAADLEFAPDDPNTIYASMWRAERKPWTIISGSETEGGLYKSTDGGENWKKLTQGLPDGLFGKADFAVSAADPDRVWALIEAPDGEGGVFRSDDRGESWELINTKKELLDRPFYYCNIDVNPQNPDNLFVSATGFWISSDGGKNWKRKRTPHGDNHGIWMNPSDSLEYVQVNDGGGNVTRDGGETWSTQMNQSTAELYQVDVDDQTPYWLYAGQQDNSSAISVPSRPPWNLDAHQRNPSYIRYSSYLRAVGGCETGPAVPKPGDPNIVYSNCKGRFGVYNKTTGQERRYYVGASNMYGHNPKDLKYRFQRVSPIHVSPHDPNVIYHASQYLHKTTDEGKTWKIISPDLTAFRAETQVISGSPITRDITGEEFYSTIYAVQESPLREGLIWVGANDGPIHVTKTGGTQWQNVTPDGLYPDGRVQCVEPSPHNEAKAYVAVYRYLLNDWRPFIYRTNDYGESWTLLTPGDNGIPVDFPTRVIREDPAREGLLYAGTEYGLFVSLDDGETWTPFQFNLPVTPITDIKVHQNDLVLSTMGRGFWILDDITPLHDIESMEVAETTLYQPRQTHRMRYSANDDGSVPNYPSPGALINFSLSSSDNSEVVINIKDSSGETIRSFTSEKEDEKGDEGNMATGFEDPGPETRLTNKAGGQQLLWDLRHQAAWKGKDDRNVRGPVAAPGTYSVELVADGQTFAQSFEIVADPRILASGTSVEDMTSQEELALAIRDLISETRQMADYVKKRRKEIAELTNSGKGTRRLTSEDKSLASLQSELVTEEGRYMTPKVIDQLRYLYSMLDQADQAPGQDATERFQELKVKVENLKSQNSKILARL